MKTSNNKLWLKQPALGLENQNTPAGWLHPFLDNDDDKHNDDDDDDKPVDNDGDGQCEDKDREQGSEATDEL